MSLKSFTSLPDHSRLWVFPSSSALTASQREALAASLEKALAGWNAHGSEVRWGYTFVEDRFLMVAVDEDAAALTGCSIDSAVHAMQAIETSHHLTLTDSHRVFFRGPQGIEVASRAEFEELAAGGRVTLNTSVFDTVIASLGALRSGQWELAAKDSWHAHAFSFEVAP